MDPEQFREDFATLIELLREGKIHPTVAERLPLSEARHAHELLASTASKRAGATGGYGLRALISGAPCGSPRQADAAASRGA